MSAPAPPSDTAPGRTRLAERLLHAMSQPVLLIEADEAVSYANASAEQFFAASRSVLARTPLSGLIAPDNPVVALVAEARRRGAGFSEYDMTLDGPRVGRRLVDAAAAPFWERPGAVVLTLQERDAPRAIDRQMSHRAAARAVTGMAATLAHEIKNPLAGIRGAAQLLQDSVEEEDRTLAVLIREEADRIRRLIDEMDVFGDTRAVKRAPVNIHAVLQRVKQIAQSSFAGDQLLEEDYDPSLPAATGDADKLVQIFLNLIKNASDAVRLKPGPEGRIRLKTAYRPGVRMRLSGAAGRARLPLEVSVEDNGPGVPDHVLPNMYDAFVTGKPDGRGLGLALVAKLVEDHGGLIECETGPSGTAFRVLLPLAPRVGAPTP